MSEEIPERVLSAIRRAACFHGIGAAGSLIGAIFLTTNLPRMGMDGSGVTKAVIYWIMAFFSSTLPLRLMQKTTTNVALKQTRVGTCVVAALCLICAGHWQIDSVEIAHGPDSHEWAVDRRGI